jgi:hypothetical protein
VRVCPASPVLVACSLVEQCLLLASELCQSKTDSHTAIPVRIGGCPRSFVLCSPVVAEQEQCLLHYSGVAAAACGPLCLLAAIVCLQLRTWPFGQNSMAWKLAPGVAVTSLCGEMHASGMP